MNWKWMLWTLAALAVLVVGCSLPQNPFGVGDDGQDGVEKETELMVETDTKRGQGVYVNELGVKIDIVSFEEEENRSVRCVEAIDIVALYNPTVGAKGFRRQFGEIKGVIIGIRDDGHPGVWAVYDDDSIHPLNLSVTGKGSSLLPESQARRGYLRGLFGWSYTPIAARSDGTRGFLIVGEALNENGFDLGHWSIEPGTTVGVYWRLTRHSRSRFWFVTSAQVIGTPQEDPWGHSRPGHGFGRRHVYRFVGRLLSSLRLFFLSYYEAYLVDLNITVEDPDDLEEFWYDAEEELYFVRGIDQGGDQARASIAADGTVIVTKEEPGGGGPVDLAISNVSVNLVEEGGTYRWMLQSTVENLGTGTSPACEIAYYLSEDDTLNINEDTPISDSSPQFVVSSLGPGAATVHSFTIDPVDAPNVNYILVKVDSEDQIVETNELNNVGVVKIRYPRIVIESFHPEEGPPLGPTIDTYLELHDQEGTLLAFDDNGILFAKIDYQEGLVSGVYYIRVNSDTDQTGPYAIRVVEDDAEPYPASFTVSSDDYEADDPSSDTFPLDGNPVTVTLGSENRVGRLLDPIGDVDWLTLRLQ